MGNNLTTQSLRTLETHQASPLLKVNAFIEGKPAVVMIDSGASCCFISRKLVKGNRNIKRRLVEEQIPIELATGVTEKAQHVATGIKTELGSYKDRLNFVEVPLKGCDAIIGMTWLKKFEPEIRWSEQIMNFWHQGRLHWP